MAGVKAYEVGVKYMDGCEVDPNTILYPQLRAVPMGWSWGVALVQEAHLHLLAECGGLDEQRRAVDFRPHPAWELLQHIQCTSTIFVWLGPRLSR